jgi:hypothetical protein
MALMTTLCKRLNILLAKHKVVGPSTVIEYLVIILNTEKNGGPFATGESNTHL